MFGFIQNLGAMEIFLIFMIILLLFGAKRLPELFKSFGKSLKEFKKATSDIEEDFRDAMDTEDKKPPKRAENRRDITSDKEGDSEAEQKQADPQKKSASEPVAQEKV